MALTLGDNFSYQGAKPLDGRLKYDTVAAMKAVADATMYDGCMAYCTATDKTYQWKSSNTVDSTTGKWREFKTGGGHVIYDEEGNAYPQRSKLVFENCEITDDSTSDCTIVSAEGGGGAGDYPLDDVTGASISQSFDTVTITWTDPNDVVVEGVTVARWAGTEVVRKAGSAPMSPVDGTVVVDNTLRNNYSTNGFTDTELTYGTTYYYRFFPYKMSGANKVYTNSISVSQNIARIAIQYVPSTASQFTYNRTEQTPIWANYDSTNLTMGGDISGTNAGTYNTTFTPKSGYMWEDGTLAAKNISWNIAVKAVTVPTLSGTYTYNRSQQTVTISQYDSDEITVTGDTTGTNADTYTVGFELTSVSNYKWSDNTTLAKSATWTIAPKSVSVPALSGSYTYNGTQQSVSISAYDSNEITVGGDYEETDAGTYTVTFSLTSQTNYVWSDTTTAQKSATWTIAKYSIVPPIVSSSFTYDGTAKTATVTYDSNEDVNLVTITNTSQTNAGTYTSVISLNDDDNYIWSDGTSADKSAEWTIAKANHYCIVSKQSIMFNDYPDSDTFTVSDATGEVSITSNNTSKVTVSPSTLTTSGGTVTVTRATSGVSAATVTVAIASDNNHNAFVAEVEVTSEFSLAIATWAEVKEIGNEGIGASFFAIGDTKEITLNGAIGNFLTLNNFNCKVFIVDFNYKNENGIYFQGFKSTDSTPIDIVLCDSKTGTSASQGDICFNWNHYFNTSSHFGTVYGGWKGSDMRYDILGTTNTAPSDYGKMKTESNVGYDATNEVITSPKTNTLMAALPNDLRTVLAPWTVYENNQASIDYLTILSYGELTGNDISYPETESQMTYYANGNSLIKYKHTSTDTAIRYLTRTAMLPNTLRYISNTGEPGVGGAGITGAIAPAFRVA